jgi:hypothetical protein
VPAQQLRIDLRKLLEELLHLPIMLDPLASVLPLRIGFEQKFIHPSHGQRLSQIIERTVLGAAVAAFALLLPANREALHIGGAQQVGKDLMSLRRWSRRWRSARVDFRPRRCILATDTARIGKLFECNKKESAVKKLTFANLR